MQKMHYFLSVIMLLMFFALPLRAQQNLDREIEAIVAPLVASISNQPVKNVAISDFTLLDGTPTELGKYLAEEFSLSLINAKKSFVVIDRSRVTALLKENNLGSSGLIDPNTIAKLGKMKGIDALIAGTMTSTGNTIRLIVKVWNLESQGLVAGNKGDISKTPFIMELEGKTVSVGATNSNGGANDWLSKPVNHLQQSPSISQFTKGSLSFELISCTQSGQNVECKVRLTSIGKDINIETYRSKTQCRILPSSGNEYPLTETKLGDKVDNKKSLVSNVPIVCVFTFSNVTEKIDLISKLEIRCSATGMSYFQLEFRNIKVK